MLLKVFLPAAVISVAAVAAALHAALPLRDATPAAQIEDSGSDSTLAQAPFSLGNPFAAATLQLLRQIMPYDESPAPSDTQPATYTHTVVAEDGDTLAAMLGRSGISREEAHAVIAALRSIYDPRQIRPGQEIALEFSLDPGHNGADRFVNLSFAPDFKRRIDVARDGGGRFAASEWEVELNTALTRAAGTIDHSLYVASRRAGVPGPVLAEMIRAFSWDIDFQRDIQLGDKFEVLYEAILNDKGEIVHTGAVAFAALILSGTRKSIYRHVATDGYVDYFDLKGQSVRKALLRTPIDGARLSSGYGQRLHPILGFTTMHRGVDFAAPKGTPIYAAGDGVIAVAEFKGAYGKYVQIRHTGEYATAYAHMSGFAKGMAPGRRIRQGQVVGYVGTTGRSTGPHLHYEVLRHGKQTNPMRVVMPTGRKLAGAELARFAATRADIERRLVALSATARIAAVGQKADSAK